MKCYRKAVLRALVMPKPTSWVHRNVLRAQTKSKQGGEVQLSGDPGQRGEGGKGGECRY